MSFFVRWIQRIFRGVQVFLYTALFTVVFLLFQGQYGPQILRWYLRRLGAGFVKAGQLLAHRYDMLPPRYCEALEDLLEDVGRPAPFSTVQKTIEKELGTPLSAAFASLSPKPFATASIAQVHAGHLVTGESVVVKFKRPNIDRLFEGDRWLMRNVVGLFLSLLPSLRRLGVRRLIAELDQLTLEELDFHHEANNLAQLHKLLAEDEIDHYVPHVYWDFSRRSFITMEFIEGVSARQLIRAVDEGNTQQLDKWAESNITPERTACLLVRSFLEQAMRHRTFQTDPHASNLIMMEGGTLAWIDFGMVGRLDERTWKNEFRLREAIAEGRVHDAYNYLLASLEPLPQRDLTEFENDFKTALHKWLAAVESGSPDVERRSNSYFFRQTLVAIRKAGLRLSPTLMRLYRTIIVGDMVMLKLDPSCDWRSLMREFISDEQLRHIADATAEMASVSQMHQIVELALEAPAAMHSMFRWIETSPERDRQVRVQLKAMEKVVLSALSIIGRTALGASAITTGAIFWLRNQLDTQWTLVLAAFALTGILTWGLLIGIMRWADA